MEDDIDGVVANIRCCIISNKGPISIRNLSRDYETIVGSPIPFRQFRYSNLEEFLRSLPTLRVCGSGSQAMVEAAASSQSQHISAMVAKQKSTAKRGAPVRSCSASYRGRGSRGRGRGSYPSRPYAARSTWGQPSRDSNSWDYSTRGQPARGSNSWGYSTRDQPARDSNSREYSTRDQPAREYSTRDQPAREYSTRDQPSRDSNSREYSSRDQSTRDYNSRELPTRDQPTKDYSSRNHSTREQTTRDSAAGEDQPTKDNNHTNSAPKKYSPEFHNGHETAQPVGPITVMVDGDNRRQVSWNKKELPPRFKKLLHDRYLNKDNPPAPSISPEAQMVLQIHCLGSTFANELVAFLQTDTSFSPYIHISQFFYLPDARIQDFQKAILDKSPKLNKKIPLLMLLGEKDVLMTTDKIKELKKDYMSLIFILKRLCPGIQLILVHLPICFCSYRKNNYLERIKSFNESLSTGLHKLSKGMFVVELNKFVNRLEFFNCGTNKFNPFDSHHVNERGYSALVRFLVSQLHQGFGSNYFLDQSSSASNSATIISPLGPSQLIARGLAQQQAEKAKEQQYDSLPSDFLLQSSSLGTNGLEENFARLSHQDSFNSASALLLRNRQASFNGQQQIPESLSMLHLPKSEDVLPIPDELVLPNNIGILDRYCLSRGWNSPTFIVLHHKCPDTHKVLFFATVKVNGDGANTFKTGTIPFEHENVEIVKGFAAKKALEKIIAEESKVKADKCISSDTNIMCNRISDIVAGASTGMFANSVEDEYIKRHNELLPRDWLQTLNSWPTVSVESTVNSTIIVPRNTTFEPVQFDPTSVPPPLDIEALGKEEDLESVYITHASSVSQVWFNVIGTNYSDELATLKQNMESYYSVVGTQELALVLEVGHYYAAHKFEPQRWFRVCVLEVHNDSKTVVAWLVDHGDNESFPFGSLYRLAPQFCKLPQQAVQCTLEGLESFNDDDVANEVVSTSELLIGESLIAKINFKDKESGFMKVTLYDTKGEDDIIVNEHIKEEIIAKTTPALPAVGCPMEVAIGDVSKKGEVYLMFAGPSLDRISEVIESLGPDKISEHKLNSFKVISMNKMYLAKYSKDEVWYRAVVIAPPSLQQNKIPVRFVDYGNTEAVSISDIADLENLPPILKKLPPQAMKVALHNLPLETLTNPEVARLHSLLLDEDKVVLIKTISLKENPPIVEIFTKDANQAFVSVNSTIEFQRMLYGKKEENMNLLNLSNSDANSNQFSEDSDRFVLKCPDLSDSEFQAVLVVLAAHPGNFIFQAKKYAKELKTLRVQLNAYYDAGALPEVASHRVVKNKLFAAQYTDDMWYRVVVTDSPMGNKVPVRLCDYGDVTCVNISNLRELAPMFHEYPFLAVMGKLAGVVPIHKDWSVEDCIRFQKLVVNQILAGVIVDIRHDNQNPMDMVVTLKLVNTDSEEDQNIADILIRERRAVKG